MLGVLTLQQYGIIMLGVLTLQQYGIIMLGVLTLQQYGIIMLGVLTLQQYGIVMYCYNAQCIVLDHHLPVFMIKTEVLMGTD